MCEKRLTGFCLKQSSLLRQQRLLQNGHTECTQYDWKICVSRGSHIFHTGHFMLLPPLLSMKTAFTKLNVSCPLFFFKTNVV